MHTVNWDELEEIALSSKETILRQAEQDNVGITIQIYHHGMILDHYHILIDPCGNVEAEENRFLDPDTKIHVAIVVSEDEPSQMKALAETIAVLVNALDIEFDTEHIILPDYFPVESIMENAEWFLTNGLE